MNADHHLVVPKMMYALIRTEAIIVCPSLIATPINCAK